MTRICLLGDIHWGIHRESPIFMNALRDFFQFQLLPYLKEHNIRHLIQVGDVVDKGKGISYVALNRFRNDIIDPLLDADLNVHFLVGNHDISYKDELFPSAPAELFSGLPFKVYDRPCETVIGGLGCIMLPWLTRKNADECFHLLRLSKYKVIFCHAELNGFPMYRGVMSQEGMSPEIFQDFSAVYSGHYHEPSSQGVIHYLGAPVQLCWSDAGCNRGFWILDSQTLKCEFIPNKNEMYVIDPAIDDDVKDKFVKVKVKAKGLGFDNYIKSLEEAGAIEVKIVENEVDLTSNIEIDDSKYDLDSPTKIFHDYVEGLTDKTYDKKKLESILVSTHTESLNL